MKRVIMSLHGIESCGSWQKELTPILVKQRGFMPWMLDYGKFPTVKFLWPLPPLRKRKIDWFLEQYTRVCSSEGVRRPSIVAHSFGTYIVAEALDKYPQIRLDKVIFCGGIVRRDFPWRKLYEREQVNVVYNEYGRLDFWARVAGLLLGDAGSSGADGFGQQHSFLEEQEFRKYGHPTYFHPLHFKDQWIPLLNRLTLSESDRDRIRELQDLLLQGVARRLAVSLENIRSNIFWLNSDGYLRIPEGLHSNMDKPDELTVQIRPSSGCTGRAYAGRRWAIAILAKDWGKHTLPTGELAKLHPELRWVVAMPIPDPDEDEPILGVLSVDGLRQEKTRDELETIMNDLQAMAKTLGHALRECA